MRHANHLLLLAALFVSLSLIDNGSAPAGDWPQILGPHRDGSAQNESLAETWSASGPKTVWQRDCGSGFSGLAVADGRAVLFHRIDDQEVVECLDVRSGESLWKAGDKAKFVPSYTPDDGPRSVPLIHNGRVFTYGALGELRAWELKSGKRLWARDPFEDYGPKRPSRGEPPEGFFGIGNTPIVDGDKLIVNVGGAETQAGIVAFDLDTGKTLWKATDERASYSSPVAVTVGGKRHVIVAARFNVVSLDPNDGGVRFRFPFGTPGPNVTAANPVVVDGHLFITASYGFGALFARLSADGAQEIWRSDDLLSSQYTTCVADGRILYGAHGRQDVGRAALRCIDPFAQKMLWEQPGFGYATLIKADGKLIILKTDGELVLARVNSKKYEELARAKVLAGTTRALPALSNGRLFIRDDRTVKCLDLGASQ